MQGKFASSPPLGIAAYSDHYDIPPRKVWGDYWIKETLIKEFASMGYPVDNASPAALLHLFGEPLTEFPRDTYNILWIHSHPDWISPDILERYDKVFCISESFCERIAAMGFTAEPLMVPTAMRPVKTKKEWDLVFVGNTKQGRCRKIVAELGETVYDVKIWGWGWKGLVPDEWIGGEYYENGRLNKLYASARIVLNDHHEDMRREGFINPRILDVLASGGFVISDRVKGIEEFFEGAVPVYDTPEDLARLIDRYMKDDDARQELSERGRTIALRYTYRDACAAIIRAIIKGRQA
jgi:spore maturation protein CgeB